jgi:WS/DGAT/MGAT family acyltransferase
MVTRIARRPAAKAAPATGGAARPTRAARPRLAGERMAKVDTAWLRMDNDHNLMMILGVWTLRPGIGHAALCRRVEERLFKYPRFRQRVVEDATGASWVEDPQLDVAHHVVREVLPPAGKGGAQAALQARIAQLASQPLDRAHPLWQLHLVEDHDGGSALIVRIHHCIADGIALISVALSLVDGGAPPPERRAREDHAGTEDWIADTVVRPLAEAAVKAIDTAGDGLVRSMELLREPHKGVEGSAALARLGWQVAGDAAALLLMPDDTRTCLKGQPVGRKRVAWCEPLPLEEVKAVGKALGCSVNDVLLSCVAGAIGGWLRDQGEDTDGCEIRAMVPVNLRPLEQAWKLGNRFGLVPLVLPVGIAHPLERLYEVRRRMNALKGSTQPLLAFAVLTVAGLLVKPAQDAILRLFADKTTAVMTNVPGPREKLKMLGSTLQDIMFWVPQSGDIGLGVSILSYGGGVQFGLMADEALCRDPQAIIDGFTPQFEQLGWLTLMLPWGEGG